MKYRAGYITIVGNPNVGKSTLLNRLLDFKLSIISPKPQTTRKNILGILNRKGIQIVFNDTPGMLTPRYLLQEKMVRAIQRAIEDADGLILVLDGVQIVKKNNILNEWLTLFLKNNKERKKTIVVINKIDLMDKQTLLPLIKLLSQTYPFYAIIPVSALTGDGLEQLINTLTEIIPEHPPFYSKDLITDHPERFLAAELIREQIFLQFEQEIPYGVEVQIESFYEREKGKDFITATIFVERASQKGMLIGQGGSALKKIGQKARKEIERTLSRKIYLDLRVKVSEKWRKSERIINKFGY